MTANNNSSIEWKISIQAPEIECNTQVYLYADFMFHNFSIHGKVIITRIINKSTLESFDLFFTWLKNLR